MRVGSYNFAQASRGAAFLVVYSQWRESCRVRTICADYYSIPALFLLLSLTVKILRTSANLYIGNLVLRWLRKLVTCKRRRPLLIDIDFPLRGAPFIFFYIPHRCWPKRAGEVFSFSINPPQSLPFKAIFTQTLSLLSKKLHTQPSRFVVANATCGHYFSRGQLLKIPQTK